VEDLNPPSASGNTERRVDWDIVVRSVLFIGAFLLAWVSLHPLQSLADLPQQTTESGDWLNQVGFVVFFIVCVTWAYFNDLRNLKPLFSSALIAILLWFALCVVTSWDPALSARRFAFTVIVLSIAGITLLLPRNLRHFSDLLAISTLLVLILCYCGVFLAPSVSVHQATDFLEPEHAGSWRGVFSHKNEAGATMVIFIMIGLFVARVRSIAVGGIIVGLATVFLLMSHSKTSLSLLPLVLILSALIGRARGCISTIALAVGGLVLLNIFLIGSLYSETIQGLLSLVVTDTTFTARTDIWKFTLQEVARSPITGFGFSAFWGTPQVVYGLRDFSTWATAASDAHNTYLNLLVTVGIPGLVLVTAWIVFLPALHFFRQIVDPYNRVLAMLFLRVWIFGVYASCFESTLFQQVGEVWFIFIIAVFGLQQLTVSRVKL
jgi:O-antigen ligase